MEDKLVTLAILTYAKAQILKNVLIISLREISFICSRIFGMCIRIIPIIPVESSYYGFKRIRTVIANTRRRKR